MEKFTLSNVPSSVYRLQLGSHFTLKQATRILPYLKDLGIEAIYSSPIYDAYSSHGYDVTDPCCLNPALGTGEDLEAFFGQLKKLGLGFILDVVPNHMGMKGGKNHWWQDVLENGPYSEYAAFFDIDWSPEKRELQDKVLLPILEAPYGESLESQKIHLTYGNGSFWFQYKDYPFPLAPHTYASILEDESLQDKDLLALVEFYKQFPLSIAERKEKSAEGALRLAELCKRPQIARYIKDRLAALNGKRRVPESFDKLDELISLQYYRLSYWRVASHEINYRRFFNIYELVAICIEKQAVLEQHHKWIFDLIEEGKVQGLRIDHPDGLYDPVAYFQNLRSRFSVYTVVEKILDRKENLPEAWAVEGTVGYESINMLCGLFVQRRSEKAFTEIYEEFVGKKVDFAEVLYHAKKLFTTQHMVSEVKALGLKLDRLSEHSRLYCDFTRHDLTAALQEVIACFPVYRTYIAPEGKVSRRDARYLGEAIDMATKRAVDLDTSVFDFIRRTLLGKLKVKPEEEVGYREFILRFQQLTGPIMAKGFEDTTFYIYNRLISLNEVGGDPTHFGHSDATFHEYNQKKRVLWPFGFLTSTTHDTKRSEDVRMRLNALTEIPEKWRAQVNLWREINSPHKQEDTPTPNAEYFIYQTLLGVWPKRPLRKEEWGPFTERIWAVILKSLREARGETSWTRPNSAYESGVQAFLKAILTPDKNNRFLKEFLPFQKEIDRLGSWNSLSATALKLASCGVVDIYQGTETFQYTLVDPDNRRPVDFEALKKGGGDKHRLYKQALNFRKRHKELFLEGEYHPIKARGACKEHVVAIHRKHGSLSLIAVAGRFFASLVSWGNTEIVLPKEWVGKEVKELFSGQTFKITKQGFSIAPLFSDLPIGYLYDEA